jgi:tRNA A-37 threonylcarbamoyl transferase component Bud32
MTYVDNPYMSFYDYINNKLKSRGSSADWMWHFPVIMNRVINHLQRLHSLDFIHGDLHGRNVYVRCFDNIDSYRYVAILFCFLLMLYV